MPSVHNDPSPTRAAGLFLISSICVHTGTGQAGATLAGCEKTARGGSEDLASEASDSAAAAQPSHERIARSGCPCVVGPGADMTLISLVRTPIPGCL